MENLIGMAPPPPEDPKERAPAGAPFDWIWLNFGQCPEGANRDTIRTYTCVYLWYMISRTLFPDSGGKLAHWCWLKALKVLEHRWSRGTAALAYLYRQLDETCHRTGSGGIGGCLLLLSVWSWDRLSVGRPRILNERPWHHHRNNLDREPTWAYLWDNVSEMTSDPKIMYMHYTEELDTLTAEQGCPPQWQDTDHTLHSNYLQWFHQSTRIELVKPAYDDDILDDPIEFDEVAQRFAGIVDSGQAWAVPEKYLIDHSSPSYAHIKVNIGYNKKITSSHQSAELAGRQRGVFFFGVELVTKHVHAVQRYSETVMAKDCIALEVVWIPPQGNFEPV
ncbi:uncharacterized protein LOC124673660 [Lolium rigidum]|uniref:uncharacterized protein LOC124673660 n=1 Tax=Lolium rigidum TaxID=89674 RepID=UPI001F5CA537|nr:uncharacterized protein LOC124673660 [Lolium rigidum]